jgi:hypothetical protein
MRTKQHPRLYKANVYSRDPEHPERAALELSMIRGAFNGVVGYARLGGQTNARFVAEGHLQFSFRTKRKRRQFIRAIQSRMRYVIVRRVVPRTLRH